MTDTALKQPTDMVQPDLDALQSSGWRLVHRDIWTHLQPPLMSRRVQGWKLHISATVESAPEVLRACLPVLTAAAVQFKFARSRQDLSGLNDFHAPRGSSGKFITVYPAADDVLRRLAADLHEATRGLAGPAILSDTRYAPDSLVHSRYGAFDGFRILTLDGMYRDCILDPDTVPVEDQRLGYFSPPAWTRSPFAPETPVLADKPAAVVLLNDRYKIETAIRHANKGGVYRATDLDTGAEVIIKEARPHVATDRSGQDARDYLRQEAAVLRLLAPLGLVPALIEEFEQGGHSFLAEEFLDGQRLLDRFGRTDDGRPRRLSPIEGMALAATLTDLVRQVHEYGVVLRDLTPGNLLVMPDGSLRLIDLELAAVADGETWRSVGDHCGTPGIGAPEQLAGAAPHPTADHYSLGATILQQLTRRSPDLALDAPEHRPLETRIEAMLTAPLAEQTVPDPLRTIVVGLMRQDPSERLTLEEAAALSRQPLGPVPSAAETRWSSEQWDELVQGSLGQLVAWLEAADGIRPWPETPFGERSEPCSMQYGVGGNLAVYVRLLEQGVTGPVERLAEDAVRRLTRHLKSSADHRLPGMNYGFAGTAWSLYDAGRVLERPDLTEQAWELVAGLPTTWPIADLTHGLSGLGTSLLHLSGHSGDVRLLERAERCAETVLALADPDSPERLWTVPSTLDSTLAGYRSYGFAHGTAGIGAFLLAAGRQLGRTDLEDAAVGCGETLLAAAVVKGDGWYWPAQPGLGVTESWWCNGSPGILTFLCRLHARTGDHRYREASIAAARAVMADRWEVGSSYCHGLAGNADSLLDLAAVTGDALYTSWAEELAGQLWAGRFYRDGRAVIADERGNELSGGYAVGLGGQLAFLSRLRHGGGRLFHPDPAPELIPRRP